jgi:hypothetical protein
MKITPDQLREEINKTRRPSTIEAETKAYTDKAAADRGQLTPDQLKDKQVTSGAVNPTYVPSPILADLAKATKAENDRINKKAEDQIRRANENT